MVAGVVFRRFVDAGRIMESAPMVVPVVAARMLRSRPGCGFKSTSLSDNYGHAIPSMCRLRSVGGRVGGISRAC